LNLPPYCLQDAHHRLHRLVFPWHAVASM
jgi:hypothetical protein